MTFSEKCAAAEGLLESKGISRMHYSPLLYRLLRRFGVTVPPPHFASFGVNVLWLGGLFALVCYLIALITWTLGLSEGSPVVGAIPYVAVWGLLFGLLMAGTYAYGSKKHAIPRWSAFHPNGRASS